MLNKEAFVVSVGEGRWYYGVVFHVVIVPPAPIMTVKLFRIKEANKESGEKEYLELKYSNGSTMLVQDISKLPPDGEYRVDCEGSGDNDGVLTVEGEKVSFNLDTYPNSGVAVTVDALVARGG